MTSISSQMALPKKVVSHPAIATTVRIVRWRLLVIIRRLTCSVAHGAIESHMSVFVESGRIELDDNKIQDVGPNDALIRITTTITICGTDDHILKGDYPVEKGLTIGHGPAVHLSELP